MNKHLEPLIDESGFSACMSRAGHDSADWAALASQFRWLAIYPVEGGSEGHYVHMDLIGRGGYESDGKAEVCHLGTAKTFGGFEAAQKFANAALYCMTHGTGSINYAVEEK